MTRSGGMAMDIKNRLFQFRHIDEATGCWLWRGAKFLNGYGSIKVHSKSVSVHRLSLIVFKGIEFKPNEQANHKCSNKDCFNPEHLYVGSQDDNMFDRFGTKCMKCGFDKGKGRRCSRCKRLYMRKYMKESYHKNK